MTLTSKMNYCTRWSYLKHSLKLNLLIYNKNLPCHNSQYTFLPYPNQKEVQLVEILNIFPYYPALNHDAKSLVNANRVLLLMIEVQLHKYVDDVYFQFPKNRLLFNKKIKFVH